MGEPSNVARTSRITSTASPIFGAGCSNGMPNRCSLIRFTCVPNPRTNRPSDSSARSRAAIAVIVGLRGNARAMFVPTRMRDVAAAATAAWTKADRAVSATHTLSNPASSTSRESAPSPRRGPPTTTPESTTPEGYTLPTARMGGGATVPACLLAHVLGARAKALSHDLQHLRGDRGTGLDEPLEVPRGQAEHGDLRLGGHRSRP